MVMATAEAETSQVEELIVPLDEVLGEAEAKYGPMPACIRALLLPVLTEASPESGVDAAEVPTETDQSSTSESATLRNGDVVKALKTRDVGESNLDVEKEVDNEDTNVLMNHSSEDSEGLVLDVSTKEEMRYDDYDDRNNERDDDRQEGGISLDDISLLPSSLEVEIDNENDQDVEVSQKTADAILFDLTGVVDGECEARRSPDSGCSMSEASADDRVSIASTVSSSDDIGSSNLDKQIRRLKQAMAELREKDVALARQLLVVYDYVEETKWFLENFELCDTRRSVAASSAATMSPMERRFSQNIQKRMSDFGIGYLRSFGGSGPGSPRKPAWMELNLNSAPAVRKRHSRNISDGSLEQIKLIYEEENKNNNGGDNSGGVGNHESSYVNNVTADGATTSNSVVLRQQKSPKLLTRRSISSSCLEISLSTMYEVTDPFNPDLLSPIVDTSKTVVGVGDADKTGPPSSSTNESGDEEYLQMTLDSDRTIDCETITAITSATEQTMVSIVSTPDHHRGDPSSSSSSSYHSFNSSMSSSSMDSTRTDPVNQDSRLGVIRDVPQLSSTPNSADPIDDCEIYVVDDDEDDDEECDDDDDTQTATVPISMSPFGSWLQEQDETLL